MSNNKKKETKQITRRATSAQNKGNDNKKDNNDNKNDKNTDDKNNNDKGGNEETRRTTTSRRNQNKNEQQQRRYLWMWFAKRAAKIQAERNPKCSTIAPASIQGPRKTAPRGLPGPCAEATGHTANPYFRWLASGTHFCHCCGLPGAPQGSHLGSILGDFLVTFFLQISR